MMSNTFVKLAAVAALMSGSAVPAMAGVTSAAHVDTSGVNMQPAYPASALPKRESGAVVVGVRVKDDGQVRRVDLVRSSGFDELDSAAMNAARGWHYVPAYENGNPIDDTVLVQIVFQPPA